MCDTRSIIYTAYYAKGYDGFKKGISVDDIPDIDGDHSEKIYHEAWEGWLDGWKAAAIVKPDSVE
jgi:hypothetical protein